MPTDTDRLLSETAVPIAEFARERDVSLATVWRWCLEGTLARCRNGQRRRVKLESYRLGRTLYTTREAIARYSQALTADDPATDLPAIGARSAAQRRRASEAASRLAEAMGA